MNMLLIALGAFISFIPPIDPDFGWHFKYAEFLVNNHKLLSQNTFSYTLTDYVWHNSYWLSELLIFLAHNYLGHIFAGILFSLVLALATHKFISTKSNAALSILTVFLVVMFTLSSIFSTVRPLYFDTFFWFYLLQVFYYKTHTRWFKKEYLPLVFLVWANLHAEYLIGLFVYALYFGFQFINKENRATLKDFVVFGTSALATIINPHGIQLFLTLLKELTQPYVIASGEWSSPIWTNRMALLPVLFVLPMCFKYLKNERTRWYGITLIVFSVFTLKAVYMSRVLVLLAIPLLIEVCDTYAKKIEGYSTYIARYGLYIMVPLYLLFFVQNIVFASNTEKWSKQWNYPYKAVQVLKTYDNSAHVFNWYRWGGYLIWQLPEHKTFIDGRMSAWKIKDKYYMHEYLKIRDYPNENEALVIAYFDNYQIEYVLDSPQSPLVQYLRKKGWATLYEDDYSVLLNRIPIFANR